MKIGKILRENRSFRFYWASISFSHISGIMFNVVSAYILLLHSPTFYSLVAGATMLMGSLIRFPAGYISDIVDRKRALTITRLSQAVLILAPIVSTNFIVVSFVGFNLLTSLNGPLSAGLVQSVMEKKQIIGGTSLNSLTISFSSITGGVISLLYPYLGITAFLIVAAAMRALTALFIGNMTTGKVPRTREKVKVATSLIIFPVVIFSFLDVIPIMMNSLVFVSSPLEPSIALVSLLTTLGNGLGALLSGEKMTEHGLAKWTSVGSIVLAGVLMAIALSPLVVVYALLVLRGFLSSIQSISVRSDLRSRIPNNVMGRTWGLITTISSTLASFLALSYSAIVGIVGTRFPVLLLGLALLSAGILMLYCGSNSKKNPGAFRSRDGVEEESSSSTK